MALNDAGYILPSRILVYTAPTDEPSPEVANLDAPAGNWKILAHVGDETGDGAPSFTRDGGDVTTKGSMSKKAIRQIIDTVNTGVDMDMTQFGRDTLALYTGTRGGTTPSHFKVSGTNDGTVTETAMLIVWEDGTARVALYAPRVGWSGRDNIDTDSIEDAIRIPLHAGFLDSDTVVDDDGKPLRYDWISPTLLPLS